MASTYSGITKQVDSTGKVHTVNVTDGHNMMPLDVDEYQRRGCKPDIDDLPAEDEIVNSFITPTKEDIEQAKIVFIIAELRKEHPNLSELELHEEAIRLLGGAKDMANKAYDAVKNIQID